MRPSRLLFTKYSLETEETEKESSSIRRRASLIVNDVARASILPVTYVSKFVIERFMRVHPDDTVKHVNHESTNNISTNGIFKWNHRLESDDDDDDTIEFYDTVSRLDRLDSTASDVFHDCHSTLDAEDNNVTDEKMVQEYNFAVALYKDGRCVYPDGSPAFVPRGCSVACIPPNYLEVCHGNREKALKKWNVTVEWRKQGSVWNIH